MTDIIKAFPSITIIDIGNMLRQIRELIGQVSLAVEGIFLFTVLSGLVVLIAALQSQVVLWLALQAIGI